MINNLKSRLSRRVWTSIENTPENLAVWEWKNKFYTTFGHLITQILEESVNWTYRINVWTNNIEPFSDFEEIMEFLKIDKEELKHSITMPCIIERQLYDFFKAKVIDKLKERKNILYQNHEELFKNFIERELKKKSISPALVEVELLEIRNNLIELEKSQIKDWDNILNYTKIQKLEHIQYALENEESYIKASELVKNLENMCDFPWNSTQPLFVNKSIYNKFIDVLLMEWRISIEELEDIILSEEQINELIIIYSSFMMEPFHSKINNEQTRFVWNIMSLLMVTPQLHNEISQRFFQIPKWQ